MKSTKLVTDRIKKMIQKRLQRYHGNNACWVFTQRRWKRIKAVFPRIDEKGATFFPLELLFTQLDMDFSRKKLWNRVRIHQLINVEPHFGFIEIYDGLRQVIPLSRNEMLAWPLSKTDEIQQFFLKSLDSMSSSTNWSTLRRERRFSKQQENE